MEHSPAADSKLYSTGPTWLTQSSPGRLSESPQSSHAYAAAMRALHSKVQQLDDENARLRAELEALKGRPMQKRDYEAEIASLKSALHSKQEALLETEQLKAEVESLRSAVKALSLAKQKHHCSRCPKNQFPGDPDVECHLRNSLSRRSGSVKKLVRASQEEAAKLAFSAGKLGVLSFKLDQGSRIEPELHKPASLRQKP